MATMSKQSVWVPAALVALSLIPVIAGIVRLSQLSGGDVTPENARFFEAPWPVVLHIASVTLYCLLGAFQFSTDFRKRNPVWHRTAGRVLVPSGIIAAVTGLWMTQFYPPANFDGDVVYAVRLIVGSVMVLGLYLAVVAIRQRDIRRHRAWMMRSYALGLGAGTQVLTHIPWFVFPDIQGETARAVCMTAGWVINIAVVEWILVREQRGFAAT